MARTQHRGIPSKRHSAKGHTGKTGHIGKRESTTTINRGSPASTPIPTPASNAGGEEEEGSRGQQDDSQDKDWRERKTENIELSAKNKSCCTTYFIFFTSITKIIVWRETVQTPIDDRDIQKM
jgi:hypothetical protein